VGKAASVKGKNLQKRLEVFRDKTKNLGKKNQGTKHEQGEGKIEKVLRDKSRVTIKVLQGSHRENVT